MDDQGNKVEFKSGWRISIITTAPLEEEGENAKKQLPLEKFYVVRVTN